MILIKSLNQFILSDWQRKMRFASVGVINTGISYGLFILLYRWWGNEIFANVCSYLVGMVVSFGLNRRVVFRSEYQRGQFLPFCVSNLISMALSSGVLYLLVHGLDVYVYFAQIIAIMVSMVVNYLCYQAIFGCSTDTAGIKND